VRRKQSEVAALSVEGLSWCGAVMVIAWGLFHLACAGNQVVPPASQQPPVENEAVAAAGGEETLRLGLGERGVEISMQVAPLSGLGRGRVPMVAGDWVVETLSYAHQDIVNVEGFDEAYLLVLKHRRLDAELAVWAMVEELSVAERYIDLVADQWMGVLTTVASLRDAAPPPVVPPEAMQGNLLGLAMTLAPAEEGGGLQLDLVRVHPTTRAMQQTRLLLWRQMAAGKPVLLCVAMTARRSDFPSLVGELDKWIGSLVLTGEAREMDVSPSRTLGLAGADYGVAWSQEPYMGWGLTEAGEGAAALTPAPSEALAPVGEVAGEDGEAGGVEGGASGSVGGEWEEIPDEALPQVEVPSE